MYVILDSVHFQLIHPFKKHPLAYPDIFRGNQVFNCPDVEEAVSRGHTDYQAEQDKIR